MACQAAIMFLTSSWAVLSFFPLEEEEGLSAKEYLAEPRYQPARFGREEWATVGLGELGLGVGDGTPQLGKYSPMLRRL